MTSIMVNKGDARWGETRAAETAARKTRRRMMLVAVGVAMIVGLPFIVGIFDGVMGYSRSGPPRSIGYVAAVVVALAGAFVTWRNWRETDEMQRQLALQTWAVVGLTGFTLHPILAIIGAKMGQTDMQDDAWLASAAMGMAFYLIRRVRP